VGKEDGLTLSASLDSRHSHYRPLSQDEALIVLVCSPAESDAAGVSSQLGVDWMELVYVSWYLADRDHS